MKNDKMNEFELNNIKTFFNINRILVKQNKTCGRCTVMSWTQHIRVVNPITFIIDTINKLMGLYEVCLELITKITSTARN